MANANQPDPQYPSRGLRGGAEVTITCPQQNQDMIPGFTARGTVSAGGDVTVALKYPGQLEGPQQPAMVDATTDTWSHRFPNDTAEGTGVELTARFGGTTPLAQVTFNIVLTGGEDCHL